MAITLRALDTTKGLTEQQTAIRQTEELGFRILSLTTGRLGGGKANLATFVQQAGAPTKAIMLQVIDGVLDQDAQEAALNTAGSQLVCFGSLHVDGVPQNVAAWRV